MSIADNLKDCLTKEDISLLNEAAQTLKQTKKQIQRKKYGPMLPIVPTRHKNNRRTASFFLSKDSKEIFAKMKKSKTTDNQLHLVNLEL